MAGFIAGAAGAFKGLGKKGSDATRRLWLRPPGALKEDEFLDACARCFKCASACPNGCIEFHGLDAGLSLAFTPHINARARACILCGKCAEVCPTGALDHALQNIDDSRMGLAVIDIENCLSWQGLRCEICFRECPVQGDAITVEHHPRRISKHAMFVPLVHSDACTGCGICEKACPTQEAAIRVLQPDLVQGRIGDHYRLGWTIDSPITQEFKAGVDSSGAPAEATGIDYLNEGLQ